MNEDILGDGVDKVTVFYVPHILGYYWDIIRNPYLFYRELIQVFPKMNLRLSLVLEISGEALKQIGVNIRRLPVIFGNT